MQKEQKLKLIIEYHLNNIIHHGLFLAISKISIIHESQDLKKRASLIVKLKIIQRDNT